MVYINFDNRMKEYDFETALDIVDKKGLINREPLEDIIKWIEINVPFIYYSDRENLIDLAKINYIKQSFLGQTVEEYEREIEKYHDKEYYNR